MINSYPEPSTTQMLHNLIEFLEEHDSWEMPQKYTILEYFPLNKSKDYKPKVYELFNLTMETEDGFVISSDLEDKVCDPRNVLYSFLLESVIYIGFQTNQITLSFPDGYIRIYY